MNLASSLLVFEINKKILLYKWLSPSFAAVLNAEISKNYGGNKSNPEHKTEAGEDTDGASDSEDILFYQYFSPIINSFEISRDLNFVYEYILFDRRQHVIRFHLYKNCLVMSVYDTRQTVPAVGLIKSPATRLIHAEYYSSWYSKSFVSLMKYKFGICADEICFANQRSGFDRLYSNWSNLFINDQNFFIEAIEMLEVNDDLKLKCESFIKDFVKFLDSAESVMGELDYIEENILKMPDEDNFAFQFQASTGDEEEDDTEQKSHNKFKFTQLESFFTDLKLIDQFILSYGNKLLHKSKARPFPPLESADPTDQEDTNRSKFALDSSSTFMLLLEATDFIEYKTLTKDSNTDLLNEEIFESANSSPVNFKSARNPTVRIQKTPITRDSNYPSMATTADELSPNEKFSTPLNQYYDNSARKEESPSSVGSTSKPSFTRIKKTHAFLHDCNKSLGFYDILFLKLDQSFCLTMIKSNRLSKYCQLLAEFDRLTDRFLELLNRKRIEMNDDEMSGVAGDKRPSSPSVSRRNSSHNDDRVDKAFLSFFVNKVIIFYDKLSGLKADLIAASKKSTASGFSGQSTFGFAGGRKRTQSSASNSRQSGDRLQRRNSSISNDTMLQFRLRKVESLQLKINRLTKGKEFKHFFGFINNQSNKVPSPDQPAVSLSKNDIFSYLRMIDTQMSSIHQLLNELFHELFLAGTLSLGHKSSGGSDALQLRNRSTTPSNSEPNDINNIVFKSAHVIENLQSLYKKHLYHYIPFMDLKLYRNITISYYWHMFPGLIHFSFVNRQTNMGIVPTIDAYQSPNITEQAINTIYKKYVPIIQTLLYKQSCTQIQFVDDKLQLVFSYFIWFEDVKANYIPVNFMNSGLNQPQSFDKNSDSLFSSQSVLKAQPPGITMQRNFYELLPRFCYPNAPENSLVCYELYCIHSPSLSDLSIKNQLNELKQNLSRKSRAS